MPSRSRASCVTSASALLGMIVGRTVLNVKFPLASVAVARTSTV